MASGATQERAYILAANKEIAASTAQVEGSRWANQPAVKAKVQELLTLADNETLLRITERRKLLADTARSVVGPSSHSERIAAIKLDATLAGDLEEKPVTVAIQAVLAGLGSPVIPPSASVNTPTPVDSQRLTDTGGAPIATERVGAMGGNTVEKSGNTSFYNSPLEVLSGSEQEKNPGCGVFTNELGEEEVG